MSQWGGSGGTPSAYNSYINSDKIRIYIGHEIGHTLGYIGHSPSTSHMMHATTWIAVSPTTSDRRRFGRFIKMGGSCMKKFVLALVLIITVTACSNPTQYTTPGFPTEVLVEQKKPQWDEDTLIKQSSYIFIGRYTGNKPVPDITTFSQDWFTVDQWLKNSDNVFDAEVPINRYPQIEMEWIPEPGRQYLVCATIVDVAAWPVPIVNDLLILPVYDNKEIDPACFEEIPYLLSVNARSNLVTYMESSPLIHEKFERPFPTIADQYNSVEEMVEVADLIIETTLDIFENVNDDVYGCWIDEDAIVWKNTTEKELPENVPMTIKPQPNTRYLLFFRLVPYSDGAPGMRWEMVSRQGASISEQEQGKWEAIRELLGQK